MTHEEQQPMSEARLRAREAALVEIVRAVANGTWSHINWIAIVRADLNIVEQARALLASDSGDEAR